MAEERAIKEAKERFNIANEILKTETIYSKTLENIVHFFLEPLKYQKKDILAEELRRRIFPASLETLSKVHVDFLGKLRPIVSSWTDTSKIGDLLLEIVVFFKLYPVYVSEFETQMKALKETKASNPNFAAFLSDAFKAMNDPSNDLASLLVTPVQRIPRYLMLVKQMLKYTAQTHADFGNLKIAEEKISTIAIIVDQKAKDFENVQKMHQIDSIISGHEFALLDPQRKFIFNGLVMCEKKKAKLFAISKSPSQLGLFLFSDLFILAEPNPDKKTFTFRRRFDLLDCEVVEEKSSSAVLKVFTSASHDVCYLFAFKNEDERKVWQDHFQTSIRENNRKAMTLRNVREEQDKKKQQHATIRTASPPTTWKHVGVASSATEPALPVKQRPAVVSPRNSRSSSSVDQAGQTVARRSGDMKGMISPRPPMPQLPPAGVVAGPSSTVAVNYSAPPPLPVVSAGGGSPSPRPISSRNPPPVVPPRKDDAELKPMTSPSQSDVLKQISLPDSGLIAQLELSECSASVVKDHTVLEPNGMSIFVGETITVIDRKFSPGWVYVRNGEGRCGAVPESCVKINMLDRVRRPSVVASQDEINAALIGARAVSADVIATAAAVSPMHTDINSAMQEARSASAEVISSNAGSIVVDPVPNVDLASSESSIPALSTAPALSVSTSIPPLPEFSLNASGELVYPAVEDKSTGDDVVQSGVMVEVASISAALDAAGVEQDSDAATATSNGEPSTLAESVCAPDVHAVPSELSIFLSRSPESAPLLSVSAPSLEEHQEDRQNARPKKSSLRGFLGLAEKTSSEPSSPGQRRHSRKASASASPAPSPESSPRVDGVSPRGGTKALKLLGVQE